MTLPSVSVVSVCYNEIENISRCVESVLGQTYESIQYLVVDGDSTDGTVDVLRAYEDKIDCLIIEKDDGIYSAMNKALSNCRGDVVYFLNADDYFYSESTVENAMREFQLHPDVEILSGRVKFFNAPLRNGKPYERDDFSYKDKLALYRSPIPQQCIFSRRSLFERYGNYDERYSMCADYEWLIRMLNSNVAIRHVDDYFCHFDYTGISYTQNARRKREKTRIILANSTLKELTLYGSRGLVGLFGKLFRVR